MSEESFSAELKAVLVACTFADLAEGGRAVFAAVAGVPVVRPGGGGVRGAPNDCPEARR